MATRSRAAGTRALGDLGAHHRVRAASSDRSSAWRASSTITVPQRPLRREPFGYSEKSRSQRSDARRWKTTTRPFPWRASPTARSVRSRVPVSAGRSYDVGFTLTGTGHPPPTSRGMFRATSALGIRPGAGPLGSDPYVRSRSRGLWRAVASARDQHQRSRSEVLRGTTSSKRS